MNKDTRQQSHHSSPAPRTQGNQGPQTNPPRTPRRPDEPLPVQTQGVPPRPEIPSKPEIETEVPGKPRRDIPEKDRERAENEGMTFKPQQQDAADRSEDRPEEDRPIGKAHGDVPRTGQLEGEGSYTAARRYREGLERTIQQGDVEQHASEAAEALDGPEGEELKAAEKRAKRGSTSRQQIQNPAKAQPEQKWQEHQPHSQR